MLLFLHYLSLSVCGLVLTGSIQCVYQSLFAEDGCLVLQQEIGLISAVTIKDPVNVWAAIQYNKTEWWNGLVFLFVFMREPFKLHGPFVRDK